MKSFNDNEFIDLENFGAVRYIAEEDLFFKVIPFYGYPVNYIPFIYNKKSIRLYK